MLSLAETYHFFGYSLEMGVFPLVVSFIIGSLIGSYLNVVIYRCPRGLSVNKPARSYCPGCKKQIPWYRNIPLFTWLIQRGRCAGCDGTIPVRYFIVELLTAILFMAVTYFYPNEAMLMGWIFVALLVSISFIDGEHYVIPVVWCWVATVIALVGSYFMGDMHLPDSGAIKEMALSLFHTRKADWSAPLWHLISSFSGLILGYLGLILVVLLGKLVFGKKTYSFESPEKWFLKEPETDEDQLEFVLGDDPIGWGDLFNRPKDRIEIIGTSFKIDGQEVEGEELTIYERKILIGGKTFDIEAIKSAEGTTKEVIIPREAMGAGDPPLLGMIGAFIGPYGVIFTIFTSCIYAITAAVLGRVGFGRPLPYGPFLALGAITWIFGGYRLFQLYLNYVFY